METPLTSSRERLDGASMEVTRMEIREQMEHAVTKWKATSGNGMTNRELELARALFQERRNSRQVQRINDLLQVRILNDVVTGRL
jgi:hypothetical protein